MSGHTPSLSAKRKLMKWNWELWKPGDIHNVGKSGVGLCACVCIKEKHWYNLNSSHTNDAAIIYYGNIIKDYTVWDHYPSSSLFSTNHYIYYLSSCIEGHEKGQSKAEEACFSEENWTYF